MDWQVTVRQNYPGATEIILYRQKDGVNKFETLSYENGQQVYTDFNPGEFNPTIKPLFVVPMELEMQCDFSKKLLKALFDKGVPMPDKNFAQGKLEATEKHLEDMRKLVFDEPKISPL